jgi:glycosyltransferase involved in cell wall biosynthesis
VGSTWARVTIIQPSMHQYRVAFFEQLTNALAEEGVDLQVRHGTPSATMRARADSASPSWARVLPTLSLSVAGRRITHHRLGPTAELGDLVIAEQAIRNLETYLLLRGADRGGPPVAFWGHGTTMTKPHSSLERRLKAWMTSRAHWVFTYTEGGARQLTELGYPAQRLTVVHNTVDTDSLVANLAQLDPGEVESFRTAHGLLPGRTALFLGGLDDSKRLEFLAAACRRVYAALPDFRLVVAGAGTRQDYLRSLTAEGWLVHLGPVFADRRAILGAVSDIMLMPGRVGLSIIDAFALGLPLLTTDWPFHAPELEYLDDGVTGAITPNSVEAFATSTIAHLLDRPRLTRMQAACRASVATHRLDRMVDSFRDGVLAALAAPRTTPGTHRAVAARGQDHSRVRHCNTQST